MIHSTLPRFWKHYAQLPVSIQRLADRNFERLKADPRHPSLHLKRVSSGLWSVRVGLNYRALGRERGDAVVLFWIGPHAEYDQLLSGRQ